MVKILFFIETLSGGGAEKVLRTLVNNMDRSRFDITVMTVWPENADRYLVPGVHYGSLYKNRNKMNALRYRLEAALGLCYPMHIKGDYDVEVAYLECGATKIMAGSTNKKALKLAWVHCDLKKKTDDPAAFARKCRPWYKKFDKVVCVSENVRESFVELFGNTPESVVLYNINDEVEIKYKAKAYAMTPNVQPVFVSVGRLSFEKGNDRLLAACVKLKLEGYRFHCHLVGEGPERKKLEALVAQLQLEEYVEFIGYQENPYPYMLAADFVVCPSRFEGFSTVVTEALILGKPVVTTECSGMRELLGDSEYGLITENSEEGIYRGLKSMLDDPALPAVCGQKAAERGKQFSKQSLLQKTEAFFVEQLSRKREKR